MPTCPTLASFHLKDKFIQDFGTSIEKVYTIPYLIKFYKLAEHVV